ncbi:MAG: DUF58 domain-containing protein [Epsilonproteobacteria bacterium]|nr:DUF58 domain-containing protein [Campylobacterota bacterium]
MNQKLQTILLKAKENVYSHLSGGNLSRILGQGYDFAELREYEQGDDIRHISWINSAKLGKPYVKKMHEERELNVAVCSLVDGRFMVGDKLNTLVQVLATLGYSAHYNNDIFTLITVKNDSVKTYDPTKEFTQINRGIHDIYESELIGSRVDYSKIGEIYLAQKSLLFVIGDFLELVDLSVLAQKHEVIVVMVRDEFEENPKASLSHQLINPQTTHPINQTLSSKAIEHYRMKLIEHDERLVEHLHQHNIRYTKIYHRDEVVTKLSSIFLS